MENFDFPRHQCMVYGGDPSDQLPALTRLIIENLKARRRCLYINSPTMVDELRRHLTIARVDVSRLISLGDLVLSSDQGHLVDRKFDGERMLDLLKTAIFKAKRDGYSGLWASGDMSWELGCEINPMKLLEYERQLEEMFTEYPNLHGVCQYHASTLTPQLLCIGLCQHRVIQSNTLTRLNPFYIEDPSVEEFRTESSIDEIKEMLSKLGGPFVTIQ